MKGSDLFSSLAEDYARYRPGYPADVLDYLVEGCALQHDWGIADVGSGTGNLSRLFLEAGHDITGIEPNPEMRHCAERLLSGLAGYRSLDGSAERIPLESGSLDLIVVGQALHWFDIRKAKAEFHRVLRPDGWVAVLWNDRLSDPTEFAKEYRAIARQFADARPSPCNKLSLSDGLEEFFEGCSPQSAEFPHQQEFDLEGFLGRARSSGHIPQPGLPGYEKCAAKLTDLFLRHESGGVVPFHYRTRLFFGQLKTVQG